MLQIAHKVVKAKIESSLGGTADLRIAQKKAVRGGRGRERGRERERERERGGQRGGG